MVTGWIVGDHLFSENFWGLEGFLHRTVYIMYFEAACFAFQQRGFHILVHACIFIHIIGVTHKREVLLIG